MNNLQKIESIENKYQKKIFYLLKYLETDIFQFFNKFYLKGNFVSSLYNLFLLKDFGQPSSHLVGSDMFFEVDDAFIHIDLKTVQTRNIGDITKSIFVGTNQNSYKSEIKRQDGNSFDPIRIYEPALPTFYNKGKKNEKICLSYFITILYEDENLNILNINIICMPNGELENHYKNRVLQAGKNPDKTRFRFFDLPTFELLEEKLSRIKVVYFDKKMDEKYKNKLSFFEDIYNKQKDN